MGRIRQIAPEVDTLSISDGDTLTVKRELTYGEERAYKSLYVDVTYDDDGKVSRQPNKTVIGIAKAAAYLVEWTLTGLAGPIAVPDDLSGKLATINTLDPETVEEIVKAVNTHEEASAARKKLTATTSTIASSSASAG